MLIINIRDTNMIAAISLIIKKQTCIIRANRVILLIVNKYLEIIEIVVKLRLSRLINAVPRKSHRSFKNY